MESTDPCPAAIESVKASDCVPLFTSVAKVKFGKRLPTARIVVLVITDRNLQCFSTKSSVFEQSFSWLSLSSIHHRKHLTLTFQSNSISIHSDRNGEIHSSIKTALSQILAAFELRKLHLEKPKDQSNYYILSRLHESQVIRKIALDPTQFEAFKHMILYKEEFVTLTDTISAELFLAILPLCTFVKSVAFPAFAFTESHISILSQSQFLQFLSFKQQIPACLLKWLRTECHCIGCGFSESNLSEAFLKDLRNQSYRAFGFHNAITATAFPYFLNAFLSSRPLTILNLDFCEGIELQLLFPHIQEIPMLSLANCDLDIADVFEQLSEFPFKKLRILILTGNVCRRKIVSAIVAPEFLFSVIVNRVVWADGALFSFFCLVQRCFHLGLRLSISNFQASESEITAIFSLFGAIDTTPLVSLDWSGNPLSPAFFRFLRRSPHLESLSLSDCFSSTRADEIVRLGSYLQGHPPLR
jgi:hypothetical protein